MTVLRSATFVVLCLALARFCAVGQIRGPASKELKTITSSDRLIQIRYPNSLAVCSHQDGENPDVWSPDECVAEIPVCDNSGHAGEVMVCLAYPAGEFKKSELQAAAFAVSRIDNLRTASDCTQRWPRTNTSQIHSTRLAGLTFQSAVATESGNNRTLFADLYRIFHGGACYELDVNIAIAQEAAFAAEDAPRKLTPSERETVKSDLMQALAGFRFLK